MAGGDVFDHAQFAGRVFGAKCVAIHRAVVALRQIVRRDDVFTQHAVARIDQSNLFVIEDAHFIEHALLRFFNGEHRCHSERSEESGGLRGATSVH